MRCATERTESLEQLKVLGREVQNADPIFSREVRPYILGMAARGRNRR